MTVEMPPGPPCDVCEAEPARMSLLDYGDYSQLKIGVNCAPNVLRGIADAMDGKTTAEPVAEPEPNPEWAEQVAQIPADATGDPEWQGEPEQGSAKDHWASTTNVRRSTHGHRAPRGATGKPREEGPAE